MKPSIKAAINIMLALKSLIDSGCLAIALSAPSPTFPIPSPAPSAATAAPKAANP